METERDEYIYIYIEMNRERRREIERERESEIDIEREILIGNLAASESPNSRCYLTIQMPFLPVMMLTAKCRPHRHWRRFR